MPSHVRMMIGLAAGLALGLRAAWTQHPALLAIARGLRPLGSLFLNLLWMVVIPLVVTALFAGVAGLGRVRRVGPRGKRGPAVLRGTPPTAQLVGVAGAGPFPSPPVQTPDPHAAPRPISRPTSCASRSP